MKKANSINTIMSSKIKELTILRRSCVDWRQKEIDKEIQDDRDTELDNADHAGQLDVAKQAPMMDLQAQQNKGDK